MKLYCLKPWSYGPESYFVMAESESEAWSAFYAFQSAPENDNWHFASSRDEFDQFVFTQYQPIEALDRGQVVVNPNQ